MHMLTLHMNSRMQAHTVSIHVPKYKLRMSMRVCMLRICELVLRVYTKRIHNYGRWQQSYRAFLLN